jgi:uncharacterized metal-binding protein YceD (DUF177 family)
VSVADTQSPEHSQPQHSGPAKSELERIIKLDRLPEGEIAIAASPEECVNLAKRFEIEAVEALEAKITLEQDPEAGASTITAKGVLTATLEQQCAVSGDVFPNRIDEAIELRFVPASAAHNAVEADEPNFDEEIELESDLLDEIAFEGSGFDLGEAIAQTLGLAIDPYATGPNAQAARDAGLVSSEAASGAFAALAALKKD